MLNGGREPTRRPALQAQGALIISGSLWCNTSDWSRVREGGKSLIKQIISRWDESRLHFRAPSLNVGSPAEVSCGSSVSSPSVECLQALDGLWVTASASSPVRMFMHLEVFYYIFILLTHMSSYCCWWVWYKNVEYSFGWSLIIFVFYLIVAQA